MEKTCQKQFSIKNNESTSYIVVENEAQKEMILKKQKEMLSGNKSLDLGEESQSISEPSLLIIALVFGVFLYFNKKRRRLKTKLNKRNNYLPTSSHP